VDPNLRQSSRLPLGHELIIIPPQFLLEMSSKQGKSKVGSYLRLGVAIFVALAAMRFHAQDQKLTWILPYALLLSPFREELHQLWQKHAVLDTRIIYPAHHIPEILAQDYSYEAIRKASDNFRHPVVVRGLFNNSRAVELWGTKDYLPSVFKDFDIPIVRNATVGTLQDDRVLV
jgi:hypothetical protein